MSISKLVQSHQLGDLIQEFPINKTEVRSYSSIGFYLFLFGIPTALAVLYKAISESDTGSRNLGIGLLVVILAIGIPLTLWGRKLKQAGNIHVFESGLVEARKPTPKVLQFRDVDLVWQEIKEGIADNPFEGRIETHTGEVLHLNLLKSGADCSTLVQQQALQFQLPTALNAWTNGESISFGDFVTLTPQGLMVKGNTLIPYAQFEQMAFKTVVEKAKPSRGGGIEGAAVSAVVGTALQTKRRDVVFHHTGGEASVKESLVSNLVLLQALLTTITESEANLHK